MALAVVFAVVASYLLSRTLVPVMARYLLQEGTHAAHAARGGFARLHAAFEAHFERLRSSYLGALRWALSAPKTVFALFAVLVGGIAGGGLFIGWDFFPSVDAGQIRLHVNAPVGTRIDDTGRIFTAVQDEIRSVIDAEDLDVIIDNVGIPPSTNLAYSDNVTITSSDGEMLVSLKPDHRIATKEYVRAPARGAAREVPGVSASTSSPAT